MEQRRWSGQWVALLVALCSLISIVNAGEDFVFSKASNDTLIWGPYRPNLYFGVRPRLPQSLMTGLMWSRVDNVTTVQQNFRHTCEQNEGMAGYGWDNYDPRTGGSQTIHDAGNGLDMQTDFVKFTDRGDNGGSWGARIRGSLREDSPANLKTTVIFYAGMEGLGSLEVKDAKEGKNAELGFEDDVRIIGQSQGLGAFTLDIVDVEGKRPVVKHKAARAKPLERTFVHSLQLPEAAIWQAKAVSFSSMKEGLDAYVEEYGEKQLPPPWQIFTIQNQPGVGNLHFVQKVFEGPFEFDILYSPESADSPLLASDLVPQVKKVEKTFSDRHAETLKPQAPFSGAKYVEFSKSLFSNLIGGIGYFHGDQMIDRSYAPEYEEEDEGFWEGTADARGRNEAKLEGPYELFTSVPSRPFFPRGFLWDEGFHLLPIVDWDIELTLQIIKSWFNTMDEQGWIPREQILGPEARSKVPQEFQIQYPHYANPPTLFLVIGAFLDKIGSLDAKSSSSHSFISNSEQATEYLRELYPLLKRQFEWFRKTQYGDVKTYDREAFSTKEAYRWRGSTQRHLLTSGLDDYPRPQPPHPGELHTDLISWMGMMTSTLQRVAGLLNEEDEASSFATIHKAIVQNVDDLHWSNDHKTYCDATVDAYEESVHVCHKGYISIFPFMTGLLEPNSKHLGDVLDLIQDPEQLWSDHGIRSLSKTDEFYGTDENYWRSPVWMNMNYLIVSQLHNIATKSGPHQKQARTMYIQLRKNLVETVYKSWKETGFAWEQYNPETGQGQRTQHFTGWTSLVVKIMAMTDLEGKKHEEL